MSTRRPPAGIRFASPYRDAVAAGPRCPRDGHPLEPVEHDSKHPFLACSACFGTWFDSEVLDAVLTWSVAHTDPAEDLDEPIMTRVYEMGRQKSRPDISCPACGAEMIAEEHRRDSYVLVDICPRGCGKWLDDLELRRSVAYSRARGT